MVTSAYVKLDLSRLNFGYSYGDVKIAGLSSPRELIALVDSLPIPTIVALDAALSVVYFNTAMQELLGIPSDKATLAYDEVPYHLESRGRKLSKEEMPLARAMSGEAVMGEDLEFVCDDGRSFELVAFTKPLRNEQDEIVGAIGNFTDVTAVRHAERRSAERLAFLTAVGARLGDALSIQSVFSEIERALVPRFATHLLMQLEDEEGRVVDVRGADERELWEGDSYANVPMISHGRVIGSLVVRKREGFTADDERMLYEVARRAATAVQNAQLFEHNETASKVFQEALLPAKLPSVEEVHFDAVYAAGDDRALIGGDWYDAFELPDGRIAVSIGDVTGRGVIAAALMGKVRQTISGLSFYESDPVKLLDVAELALMRRYPDSIVTAVVGVLDPTSGEFIYATAGHPPPFLRRTDGTVLRLPCHGLPLGLRSQDEDRSSVTFRILPGDTLLLYTDGVTEVDHDPVKGEASVANALAEMPTSCERPAHFLQRTLLPNGSRDDVALLSLTYTPAHIQRRSEVLEIKFDSRDVRMARDLRIFLVRYLRSYGAPNADYNSAELVLGELLGNAARHARGPIEIHISWTGEYPILSMLDQGAAYDPALCAPLDTYSEGGRGLFLVGLLTRAFTVTRLFGGVNETRVELDVPQRTEVPA